MAEKRIAVLTLSFNEPRLLLAAQKGGLLHIVESKPLESSLVALKKKLPHRLEKLRDNGFVVLVDEVIPHFSRYGRACRLSDLDGNDKPIVVSAMQVYSHLLQYQAITFPSSGGIYEVPQSIVEEVRGADGRITYNIDWPQLQPDHVAVLIAVYAGTQDNLFDSSTLTDVMKRVSTVLKKKRDGNRFLNIMRKINSEQLSPDALGDGNE